MQVYTAADGNGEKKGEILKKDSLLLGEQYVENQDAQDWVKVWFDTDTEEGKLSGFVTAESLKKDPVENQAALQRIQNSGQTVDAWQDPGMTRPLAEIDYQPVEAPVEELADEIIEDSSADETLTDETPVDETATSADKKSAEGEAEETNRKDITFRIHWDESAMPEVGDRYRPDRVSVYLYRENVYQSTVAYIYISGIMLIRISGRPYSNLYRFMILPEMSMNTTCDLVYLILQKFINILI